MTSREIQTISPIKQLANRLRKTMRPTDDMRRLIDGLEAYEAGRANEEWLDRASELMHSGPPRMWQVPDEKLAALLDLFVEFMSRRTSDRPEETLPLEVFLWGFEMGHEWHNEYGVIARRQRKRAAITFQDLEDIVYGRYRESDEGE